MTLCIRSISSISAMAHSIFSSKHRRVQPGRNRSVHGCSQSAGVAALGNFDRAAKDVAKHLHHERTLFGYSAHGNHFVYAYPSVEILVYTGF